MARNLKALITLALLLCAKAFGGCGDDLTPNGKLWDANEAHYAGLKKPASQFGERPNMNWDLSNKVNLLLGSSFLPLSVELLNRVQRAGSAEFKKILGELKSEFPITSPVPYLLERANELAEFNRTNQVADMNGRFPMIDRLYRGGAYLKLKDFLYLGVIEKDFQALLQKLFSPNQVDTWREHLRENADRYQNRFVDDLDALYQLGARNSHLENEIEFGGRFDSFVFSLSHGGPVTHQKFFFMQALPITPYHHSVRLLRASQVLRRFLAGHMREQFDEMYQRQPELIERETMRGRSKRGHRLGRYKDIGFNFDGDTDSPTLAAMNEGIFSIAQALALLSAEKIPGFDSEQLVKAVLLPSHGEPNSLLNDYTYHQRMNGLGPVIFRGLYFKAPLESDGSGKLRLTPALRAHLRRAIKGRNEDVRRFDYKHTAGFPCPVTRSCEDGKSALQFVIEAFHEVYSRIGPQDEL